MQIFADPRHAGGGCVFENPEAPAIEYSHICVFGSPLHSNGGCIFDSTSEFSGNEIFGGYSGEVEEIREEDEEILTIIKAFLYMRQL